MARYYDMDKLKEMIEAKADTLIEGKEAFLYVAKWLDLLPAADVVPKSENERLEDELKQWRKATPIGCPECHRGCFSNDKYCGHCGTKLKR